MDYKDPALDEARFGTPRQGSSEGSADEKHAQVETPHQETSRGAAERGHLATDKYGRSLVQFDPEAEKRLRLKIDLYVLPTVAILYLFCFIDRANIGNAKLAGLEKDLHLTGYDYNKVISTFYISYIIFEIPSTTACKFIGPRRFIPALTLGFGLCSVFTGLCNNIHSASAVRFLLGMFESGMMPGIAYYLSRWYRRSELVFRLSIYIVMAPLSGAFGGLLASAILNLSHFGGLHTWRMIVGFIIVISPLGQGCQQLAEEAVSNNYPRNFPKPFQPLCIITSGLGIIGYFTMTDRPATARWLSQDEKDLAIARVKSERVAATEVLDKLDWAKLRRGIFSPVTLTTAFIFLLNNVTVQGLAFFAPEIVKTIYPTESVVLVQLHTVPPYVVGGFFTVLFPALSWYTDRRLVFFIMSAPLMMIGYIMFLASTNPHVRYGATFLIASGAFSFGALCNAQVSANVISDTARSSAIGTNVMFGNIGGLISTWSFLPFDAPNYHIGNGLNLATASMTLLTAVLLLLWMNWDNKRRDKKDIDEMLTGLNPKQVQDLDWRHPAFRWRP